MRRLVALIALGIVTFAATAAGPRSGPPDDRADRYGWNLMTPDERTEHQQKMRGFTDYAARLTYVWDNAKFLVTADAQGTQFSADLTFTQDSCTAKYHVVGVYPAVPCLDDMGKPDESVCESDVNGINPDFPTTCSKTFGYCVLKGELPAYD